MFEEYKLWHSPAPLIPESPCTSWTALMVSQLSTQPLPPPLSHLLTEAVQLAFRCLSEEITLFVGVGGGQVQCSPMPPS